MLDQPTGTVTFLFSDIEGSTKLLQHLGEGYPEVLADHQRLLRQAWADHAGVEIDTQGDSFFVVFAHAIDALAAAAQAQRALAAHTWPEGGAVHVRMGLHTGTATLSHGHYVGLDVHRAARIAAAGHGGQVLLSQATRDQVARELVAGAGLRDLGRHRLKDLPRREEIYQLVLPGMPAEYPPLKTLDAWPGYRADLTAVVLIGAPLLVAAGLLLSAFVPAFPRWIGLGAAGVATLLLLASGAARPVRRALLGQWRDARKPFAATTSALLSAVVVVTTLFVTKPPTIIGPPLNPFTYTYHAPTHTGGAITVGVAQPELCTLAPFGLYKSPCYFQGEEFLGLWQSCLLQLPDATLGFDSYKPDQCTRVPTIDNGDEDPSGRWTILRLDPRAVWSDGMPVTADDYLFTQQLYADPNINGAAPYTLMHLTALDSHTIKIDWPSPYGDYLFPLTQLWPLPLHVYATGRFAGVYDPRTDVYNSTLAQALLASPGYATNIPVDDGPFTVQSFVFNDHAVLVRNPRFFSNFFHHPAALDRITLVSALPDFPNVPVQAITATLAGQQQDLIARYRKGEVQVVDSLSADELLQLRDIPAREKITSPVGAFVQYFFNQRGTAPNAAANGGTSLFTDSVVRKAFVQAFDRCAAVRALLSLPDCTDPNLFTDELTSRPSPDYDPTFKLPPYDPAAAAAALDHAGYRVGADGMRRARDGKTPLRLLLVVEGISDLWLPLAVRMQQDWERNLHVGVRLVRHVDGPEPNSPYGGGAFDVWFSLAAIIPSDPTGSLLLQGGGWDRADIPSPQNPHGPNVFGLIDPYVVERNQLGSTIQDEAQRDRLYKSLQRYVTGQLDIVPTGYDVADVALVSPTLCNYQKSATFGSGSNLWNVADWYVAPTCPT